MNWNKLLRVAKNPREAVADHCFRLLDDPELVRGLIGYAPERSRDQWVALYRELPR